MPDDLSFTIHPGQLSSLFYRCIRCLHDHVRENNRKYAASTFYETGSKAIAEANNDIVELEVEAQQVESVPIELPEFGVSIILKGQVDAFLKTPDGLRILATYQHDTDVLQPRHFQWELSGLAFAAENPREATAPPVRVQGLGILEFSETVIPKNGRAKSFFAPAKLARLEYDSERYLSFLRMVARIVSSHRPPAAEECPYCRSSDRVGGPYAIGAVA